MAEGARALALDQGFGVQPQAEDDEGEGGKKEVDGDAEPLERRAHAGGVVVHDGWLATDQCHSIIPLIVGWALSFASVVEFVVLRLLRVSGGEQAL